MFGPGFQGGGIGGITSHVEQGYVNGRRAGGGACHLRRHLGLVSLARDGHDVYLCQPSPDVHGAAGTGEQVGVGWHCPAYRRCAGLRRHAYLGKAEELMLEHLHAVVDSLTSPAALTAASRLEKNMSVVQTLAINADVILENATPGPPAALCTPLIAACGSCTGATTSRSE
jgi:hypothetical protein